YWADVRDVDLMPYVFDPYNFSYVYYPEGSPPPQFDRSGGEYIPGYTDSYVASNPNSEAARQGATSGSVAGDTGSIAGVYGDAVVSVHGDPGPGAPAGAPTGGAEGAAGGTGGDINNEQRDAYEFLKRTFEGWGLGTLAPKILEFIQQGYDADTIMLMLQDTSEYKQRFAGNVQRQAAGLPVLNPAEYLALERQYRQIMSSAGLPSGFYDDP